MLGKIPARLAAAALVNDCNVTEIGSAYPKIQAILANGIHFSLILANLAYNGRENRRYIIYCLFFSRALNGRFSAFFDFEPFGLPLFGFSGSVFGVTAIHQKKVPIPARK